MLEPVQIDRAAGNPAYSLPAHIYTASVSSGTILLNLKTDRYSAVGGDASTTLTRLLSSEFTEGDHSAAQSWIRAGLLEPHHSYARRFEPLPAQAKDLLRPLDEMHCELLKVRLHHVAGAIIDYAHVRYSLAARNLYTIAESRGRARPDTWLASHSDLRRMQQLVSIFKRVRPLAFAAQDRCLFHALLLVTFLARYQLFPHWYVGVRLRPWAAHSWVQYESWLLDATPEIVCEYTPILCV